MKITSAVEQTAPRGGQASLGLFGIPGFDAPRQPLPRTPRSSRIKGALDSFSLDGLNAAHYCRPAAPVVKAQPAALPAPAPVSAPAIVPPVASTTTTAMWAAARASDERERRRSTEDDEADFLSRCGGEDCVGIAFSSQD